MITDYVNEPPLEGPKFKFVKPLGSLMISISLFWWKYLSSPPSSIASESLFSKTGIIDSNRRRPLLGEKIEVLTFIKRNLIT